MGQLFRELRRGQISPRTRPMGCGFGIDTSTLSGSHWDCPQRVRHRRRFGMRGCPATESTNRMPLRVIGGKYRRRQLRTPHGLSTRPYTDRVRQMVFDRIEHLVAHARVADVFSGVGTMGMEALSRGAASCVFFEGHQDVHAALKENVQTIAADEKAICWRTDINRTSFRPHGGEDFLPYDLIFFDPPYADVDRMQPGKPLAASLKRLAKPSISSPDVTMILRTPLKNNFQPDSGWMLDELWEISTMAIWKLKKAPEPIEEVSGLSEVQYGEEGSQSGE